MGSLTIDQSGGFGSDPSPPPSPLSPAARHPRKRPGRRPDLQRGVLAGRRGQEDHRAMTHAPGDSRPRLNLPLHHHYYEYPHRHHHHHWDGKSACLCG
jgi:hypothetical protein